MSLAMLVAVFMKSDDNAQEFYPVRRTGLRCKNGGTTKELYATINDHQHITGRMSVLTTSHRSSNSNAFDPKVTRNSKFLNNDFSQSPKPDLIKFPPILRTHSDIFPMASNLNQANVITVPKPTSPRFVIHSVGTDVSFEKGRFSVGKILIRKRR
jgi:hypothetical protein